MGPPNVMKNSSCTATTLHWKDRPPLCHLDRSVPGFPTSRCWQRPRVRLSVERAACRSPTPRVSTGNPGERSGEICGQRSFLGNVFRQSVPGFPPSRCKQRPPFSCGRGFITPERVDEIETHCCTSRKSNSRRSTMRMDPRSFTGLPRRCFCLRPFYSSRRSNRGSAPSARYAGTKVASSPSTIMTRTTPASTSGSPDTP